MAEKVLEAIFGILGSLVVGALPIIWVAELILSARWHRKYFASGVPIFVFRIPVQAHHTNVPSCLLLENNFKSSGFIRNTSLLFKELDTNTIGFRESLLQLGRDYSIMHGLLIFDAKNSQVIVKGFLDWTFLYFSLLWIIGGPLIWLLGFISLGEPIWLVALGYSMIFIIIGIFCLIDYFRFSKVARFAAQAWSRQYAATPGDA
jgi:hypothetical protein